MSEPTQAKSALFIPVTGRVKTERESNRERERELFFSLPFLPHSTHATHTSFFSSRNGETTHTHTWSRLESLSLSLLTPSVSKRTDPDMEAQTRERERERERNPPRSLNFLPLLFSLSPSIPWAGTFLLLSACLALSLSVVQCSGSSKEREIDGCVTPLCPLYWKTSPSQWGRPPRPQRKAREMRWISGVCVYK